MYAGKLTAAPVVAFIFLIAFLIPMSSVAKVAAAAGTGTTGAIVDTIVDNSSVSHVVIKFYVEDSVVAIMSKDAAFTPQSSISGFTTVRPGMTMATVVRGQVPLFQGTATDSQLLDGIDSTGFLSATSNDTTSGTLGILNDSYLHDDKAHYLLLDIQ